jgi:hypothetical protein
MKDEIRLNINDPAELEKRYRTNRASFRREFQALYSGLEGNPLAEFWNERLRYEYEEVNRGTGKDWLFVISAALVAGLIAKLPLLLTIKVDFFYPRNIGFIVFPALMAYFAWKNKLETGKIALITAMTLVALIFINLLPDVPKSDTLTLSCIHLPLFLWGLLGFAFVGENKNNVEKRLGYLRYNGDLIVMTTLILLAGAIMTAVTIGLFEVIGIRIERFYFDYVVVFGLAAAPIVGTYLTQSNPTLVGKVSPVIARIFSPLVLAMLVIYLAAMVYSGKDPYNDREFLMIFNALLLGVMAIIFFSLAELSKVSNNQAELWVLFLLSAVTVLVNSIALSAILFRILELGITPNRMAVLGGNILMLIHLLLVTTQLFTVVTKKTEITRVGNSISFYLPVYVFWTIIVTFIFPLLFGFK